jgi:hypothetical protein
MLPDEEPKDIPIWSKLHLPYPRQHIRAGFTTNKGRGQSKARRKMAAKSRRINRGK